MATSTAVTNPSGIDLPDLEGIQPKRRSLGQLKSLLNKSIDIARCNVKMADPNGDGTEVLTNTTMLESLQKCCRELDLAFDKWNLRLNQLVEEDNSPENQAEYVTKWNSVKKEFLDAKNLLIRTLQNVSPRVSNQTHQNAG